MTRPRLLDLFCGAGGAAMGYHQAGFEVVGVDINPQPRYPFLFYQADALTWWPSGKFDAIHASPPCQAHTTLRVMPNARAHDDLIPATRARLRAAGAPYVIENVPGAPMPSAVVLCGTAFGLGVTGYDRELRRHRLFETSFPMLVPPCWHARATIGIYGDHARDRRRVRGGEGSRDFPRGEQLALAREALGMPWATWPELTQAIPPAYTRFLGEHLRAFLEADAA